jgi:hypothetical protein
MYDKVEHPVANKVNMAIHNHAREIRLIFEAIETSGHIILNLSQDPGGNQTKSSIIRKFSFILLENTPAYQKSYGNRISCRL